MRGIRVSGAQERIPTYISGLDENMQGGIPKGHIVLLAGVSGSMKSSLGFSMLYNAVMEGKTSGIYVTLEQGKDSLGSHMAGMGWMSKTHVSEVVSLSLT